MPPNGQFPGDDRPVLVDFGLEGVGDLADDGLGVMGGHPPRRRYPLPYPLDE
jgi:hypothetical protein